MLAAMGFRSPDQGEPNTKMTFSIRYACAIALLLPSAPAFAGTFALVPFTNDSDSGINSGLTYTAAADFNGTGFRVVNNVPFTDVGQFGNGYELTGAGAVFTGHVANVGGQSADLLSDFYFTGDGSGNASLTLTGLTVGQQYVTSWYNTAFGPVGGRNITITANDTNTPIFFDQNYRGALSGNVLRYTFTATAPTITYSFDADGNGDSFHHYAFTNAVANKSFLATPVITSATGAGPGYAPFPVKTDDLLQTNLASVTSGGNFNQEGAGGVPILTDGVFVINGGNPTDNSGLATAGNDAFVEFNLDLSVNTLGYDISSIQSFGGWNDSGRDRQLFKISYSLVGSSAFTYLGAMDFNPAATGLPSAVYGVFDTALTGVDAIRIDFFAGQENGYAGFGEFDVIGAATIPEPSAAVLCLAGVVGSMMIRRRAR
jgi:hypothetical protein